MNKHTVVFLGNTEECVHSAMVAAAELLKSGTDQTGLFFPENKKAFDELLALLKKKSKPLGHCELVLKNDSNRLTLTDNLHTENVSAYVLCQDLYRDRMVKDWLGPRIRKRFSQIEEPDRACMEKLLREQFGVTVGGNPNAHVFFEKKEMFVKGIGELVPAPVLLLYNQRHPLGETNWLAPGNLDRNRYIRKLFADDAYICSESKKREIYQALPGYLQMATHGCTEHYYSRLRCSAYRHLNDRDTVQERKKDELEKADQLLEEVRHLHDQQQLSLAALNWAADLKKDAQLRVDRQHNEPDHVDRMVKWILYATGCVPVPMNEVIPDGDILDLREMKHTLCAPARRGAPPEKQRRGGEPAWKRRVAEAAARCYLFENPTREDLLYAHAVNARQVRALWLRGFLKKTKRNSTAEPRRAAANRGGPCR